MKLGLYSITYLGVWYDGAALTLEQVIERASRFGYDGVEIDGKRPHGNPLDMPRSRCLDLRRFASDHGIELYAVAANNDFSSPIPEHREAQLVYLRELLRMSADLGVNLVRVFLAWPGVTRIPEGGARYDIAKRIWTESHRDFTPEQTWSWCLDGIAEAARLAREHGVTLALQNHRPVIESHRDVHRMLRAVGATNLKACFDARLEHEMTPDEIVRATHEFGADQVLTHYGNEYSEQDGRIVPKIDENLPAQVEGLVEISYAGYLGFELCHPLPLENGRPASIEFVDRNARLAAEYARWLIAKAVEKRGPLTYAE